jgi:hypothetical protein
VTSPPEEEEVFCPSLSLLLLHLVLLWKSYKSVYPSFSPPFSPPTCESARLIGSRGEYESGRGSRFTLLEGEEREERERERERVQRAMLFSFFSMSPLSLSFCGGSCYFLLLLPIVKGKTKPYCSYPPLPLLFFLVRVAFRVAPFRREQERERREGERERERRAGGSSISPLSLSLTPSFLSRGRIITRESSFIN